MNHTEKETNKNKSRIQKYVERQIKILSLLNETLEATEKETQKNKAAIALGLAESSNLIRANLSESLKQIINSYGEWQIITVYEWIETKTETNKEPNK